MTWCQYRKLGFDAMRRRDLTVGAEGGVDLGTVLLVGAGLAIIVGLATSKRTPGFGR